MSSLQNKLYNYEQTPPANTWEKIAAALDESHISDEFPSKLYNAEVIPPATAWEKIANALETEHASPLPMRRKSYSFFRYAAAAVVIGLAAFGIIKWVGGNNDKSAGGLAVTRDNQQNNRQPDSPIDNNNKTVEGNTETQNVPAVTDDQPKPLLKKVKNNYAVPGNSDDVQPIYAYNEHTPDLADRYIMLMTPDGGIVRVSKKWENLVCCVSGQDQDADCKDQLKKWQEKLACSPVATSNFMDILSLVNTLNNTEL
jgi:hypothetical protein